MELLLTHGYFIAEDDKEQAIMKPYAPLGILYLSSYLRAKGFKVEIYDATFGSREELFKILNDGPPSVIGIYSTHMTRSSVLSIIAAARSQGWSVVLGGPEPSVYAEQYLDAGAYIIVQGEAEATLEEVLLALRHSDADALYKVPGIIFRSNNHSIVRTPARPLIADLDSLPLADRERIDLARYVQAWRERHGIGSLSLITARGCPYRCRWCSRSVYGNTHRRRSVNAVVNEIEWLLERYHPDMLWIADDVFTIQQSWIIQYAREMKERGLRIPFECITRADRIDARTADALAELGCFRIWIGCESGSQRILDAMERGVTLDQVKSAVRLCRRSGIETGMFLMWGYDGEEMEDIEGTIRHIKAAQPDILLTTLSYPIKGTPYYDDVATRIVASLPWDQSSDRDLAITGRKTNDFYAHADRLLRSELALSQLDREDKLGSQTAADLQKTIQRLRLILKSADAENTTFVSARETR